MHKILYTIKGTPLFESKSEEQLLHFLSESTLQKSLRIKKDGFTLQVEDDKERILEFEKSLLTKLITLYELHSYHKKEYSQESRQPKKENHLNDEKESIDFAANLLKKVSVIALKTPHGYHLICNASKIPSVKELRSILQEDEKPFCVMFKSLIGAEKLILLSKKEKEFLTSSQKPTILAKLKTLHQLERTTYKYTLNRFINPLNKRIAISLPSNDFYEKLCIKIPFPIVTIEATNKEGKVITEYEELIQTFGERFAHIFEKNTPIQKAQKREIYQVVYGKIYPAFPACQENADVTLELEKNNIFGYKLDKNPIDYFDEIAKRCDLYKNRSFSSRSLLLAENYFEVCEEDLFEYEFTEDQIAIDLDSNPQKKSPKQLFSTLTNTLSNIITEIAIQKGQKNITLCGRLFGYRDLTELTIEKLEEVKIKAHIV